MVALHLRPEAGCSFTIFRLRRDKHDETPTLPINFAPVANRDHEHHKSAILNRGDDTIVTDAVAPQSLAVTSERMTGAPRVIATGDALSQVASNQPLSVRTKFTKIAWPRRGQTRPARPASPLARRNRSSPDAQCFRASREAHPGKDVP